MPVGGAGYGPAHLHAEKARAEQQAARLASQQGDYGTAAKEELRSLGNRLAQTVSSGHDAPTRSTVPGTAEYNATHPGAMAGTQAQQMGAASTMPPMTGQSGVNSSAATGVGGTGVQQTTTRVTESQYGTGTY